MAMKKFFSVITIVALYVSLSCSQISQPDNVLFAGVIQFEETVHDYGTIQEGGNGTYEFIFHNRGDEPLLLNNVRSSCGCTIPEWPKEPIAAGKTGKIKVSYNTRITGPFTKSISVYTNADEKPIVLVIKGKVEEAEE